MSDFDDSLLDDQEALTRVDAPLRALAGTGARIRMDAAELVRPDLGPGYRPRGVVIVGPESRLVRALLEPCCPVPVVAWPFAGLPAWTGPLDLVVVLAGSVGAGPDKVSSSAEAVRRGAAVIVAAPADSQVARAHRRAQPELVQDAHRRDGTAEGVLAAGADAHRRGRVGRPGDLRVGGCGDDDGRAAAHGLGAAGDLVRAG
ncbi:MAG: hypothetical protein ACFN04_10730, partial [Propionibacterium acidifaciens]